MGVGWCGDGKQSTVTADLSYANKQLDVRSIIT